ncbi:hypothetical protein B4U42_01320 [Glaesserella parasuis 29755]|nr:hypothetical protein JT17_07720 [Glaesserella parasuis]AWY44745.1 hypothetical protein B4U42_01320 [Glaesserella parasuis 29755]
MAQGAKQLYFLYNPIMKVLVMGFSFAHILIQGAKGKGYFFRRRSQKFEKIPPRFYLSIP